VRENSRDRERPPTGPPPRHNVGAEPRSCTGSRPHRTAPRGARYRTGKNRQRDSFSPRGSRCSRQSAQGWWRHAPGHHDETGFPVTRCTATSTVVVEASDRDHSGSSMPRAGLKRSMRYTRRSRERIRARPWCRFSSSILSPSSRQATTPPSWCCSRPRALMGAAQLLRGGPRRRFTSWRRPRQLSASTRRPAEAVG